MEDRLKKIEKQYGKRPRIPMAHGEPLMEHHFKGQLDNGEKFVYCPVGFIISWLYADYDHEWCPWCKAYFSEVERLVDDTPRSSEHSTSQRTSPKTTPVNLNQESE